MKQLLTNAARLALAGVACHLLASCGSSNDTTSPVTYTVGGTVAGLTGIGLVVQDNGASNLDVTANGPFTFATGLATGATYAVTVLTQPVGETCTVTSGTGTVATANITTVGLACGPITYTVSVTVSGLTGTGLVLQDNGASNLAVSTNGSFPFGTALASGAAYAVTVLTQPTGQSCTVANGTGAVGTANVSNVTVACAAVPHTVSVTVSGLTGTGLVLQDNGTSNLAVTTNGTFPFATTLTTGAAYAVTVLTQPTGQSCTVTNASGTIASANITNVTVACVATLTEFLYGANASAAVPAFSINTSTGALTAVTGSPFTEGPVFMTGWLTADPIGNFMYFAQPTSGAQAWSASPSTGVLTPVTGAPFASTASSGALALSPNGNFAYAPVSNGVAAYSVSAAGALIALAGSPFFITSGTPAWVAVAPSGQFAYVASQGTAGASIISAYSVDPIAGGLTPLAGSPFAVGDSILAGLSQMTISPNGQFLYVSVSLGNNVTTGIAAYAINATTGLLTLVAGSPFAGTVGMGNTAPYQITMSPNGQFLYVPNDPASATAGIQAFAINQSTGALTAVSGSPFNGGTGVTAITVDASGKFLYSANSALGGGTPGIGAYSINQSTGALTQITGSPFASTTQSNAIYYLTILK